MLFFRVLDTMLEVSINSRQRPSISLSVAISVELFENDTDEHAHN